MREYLQLIHIKEQEQQVVFQQISLRYTYIKLQPSHVEIKEMEHNI